MRKHRWMEKIGEGFSGEVYHVYNEREERESAIKIQKSFQGDEVEISLRVNELEGFVETRDYWVGSDREGKSVACLEMELAEGNLGGLLYRTDFTLLERLEFYFEILFALNEAHREIGFFHGDLRVDNILFLSGQGARSYSLNGNVIHIVKSEKRPLVSDFGRSFLLRNEGLQFDDLASLHTLQNHLFPPHLMDKLGDPRNLADSNTYEPLLRSILLLIKKGGE